MLPVPLAAFSFATTSGKTALLRRDEVRSLLAELDPAALLRDGGLLVFEHHGVELYPGFQFDGARVRAFVPGIINVVNTECVPAKEMGQWLCLPSGYFEDSRPVDHLNNPAGIVAATTSHFGIVW